MGAGRVLFPKSPVATAMQLNMKNENRSFINDDHLVQRMRLATATTVPVGLRYIFRSQHTGTGRFFSLAKTKIKWLTKLILIDISKIDLQLIGVQFGKNVGGQH